MVDCKVFVVVLGTSYEYIPRGENYDKAGMEITKLREIVLKKPCKPFISSYPLLQQIRFDEAKRKAVFVGVKCAFTYSRR